MDMSSCGVPYGQFFPLFWICCMYNCWPLMSVGREGLQNPYWVIIHAMESGVFWFSILLASTLSCLPRFVLRSLQGSMFPSDVSMALRTHKQCETSSEASTVSVTWSRYSSNESSVDLGINPEIKINNSTNKRCSFDNNQIPDTLSNNCAINS
ncbi:putative phospholipid-transporting ATPase VA [Trichonephila clavata]|uniref:Putative phospholipid-transporting ATPase VA n=1 Tax=Trichonephila clavata TaxID=2740835 RepID=A0A8X6I2N3_TRICU|nr:putative phospholipid-transporting ATPase VA [Trichonephila clavata]